MQFMPNSLENHPHLLRPETSLMAPLKRVRLRHSREHLGNNHHEREQIHGHASGEVRNVPMFTDSRVSTTNSQTMFLLGGMPSEVRIDVCATFEMNPASSRCETLDRNHRARKHSHGMYRETPETSHGYLSNDHRLPYASTRNMNFHNSKYYNTHTKPETYLVRRNIVFHIIVI